MTTNAGESLIDRIERLESRAAIEDLVHGYARNIRNGTPAGCADCFTGDGVFEIREASLFRPGEWTARATLEGREAVRAYVMKTQESPVRVCPMIHNLIVEIDGDSATADSVMMAASWPEGAGLVGAYQDGFRRGADGAWRFTHRIYTIFKGDA